MYLIKEISRFEDLKTVGPPTIRGGFLEDFHGVHHLGWLFGSPERHERRRATSELVRAGSKELWDCSGLGAGP